jgi:hypothetical protein
MEALITACGRPDLLCQTIESFQRDLKRKVFITVHEDGLSRMGQHNSIETFLDNRDNKYYIHLEEDWGFTNSYDWIRASLLIMQSDPSIIKVLCRADAVHPCEFDKTITIGYKKGRPEGADPVQTINWGLLKPWESTDGILWHGFSWNPGVTRIDILKQFIPFAQWEQDIAKQVYDAGYKVAMLDPGVCLHIGEGRSTHE